MPIFGKPKYTIVKVSKRKGVPDGTWIKCDRCGEMIYKKTVDDNFKVCPKCDYHFVIGAYERIEMFTDEDTFKEFDKGMRPSDILNFKGPKTYVEKIEKDTIATGMKEAAVIGETRVNGKKIGLAVTDSRFIMGSMGHVVGEKITRIIEYSTENKIPVVIISGSGGGARMYEGMVSLMQMAKTSAALARHNKAGLLFISVLTNPTMAGVFASFASLGDVIIAEPRALIGFTGPRVIEQTIRQKLPEGFQRSEFLLKHGLIDKVVHRKNLKDTTAQIIEYAS